jgi:hypothetical protein
MNVFVATTTESLLSRFFRVKYIVYDVSNDGDDHANVIDDGVFRVTPLK